MSVIASQPCGLNVCQPRVLAARVSSKSSVREDGMYTYPPGIAPSRRALITSRIILTGSRVLVPTRMWVRLARVDHPALAGELAALEQADQPVLALAGIPAGHDGPGVGIHQVPGRSIQRGTITVSPSWTKMRSVSASDGRIISMPELSAWAFGWAARYLDDLGACARASPAVLSVQLFAITMMTSGGLVWSRSARIVPATNPASSRPG